DQRLAAAVPRAKQQPRRLDERCLEPGLRRRARRAGTGLPEPDLHDTREKPFLTIAANGSYSVYVPGAQRSSSGTTWSTGQTPGRSIPIGDFFIAKPGDSVQAINEALSEGKNLLFTPGVYEIDKTIKVKHADTIVLGLGMPTLEAENGVVPMTVADRPGIEVSELMFDA